MPTVRVGTQEDLDRLVASGDTVLIEVCAAGDAAADVVAAVCDEAISRCGRVTHARMDPVQTPGLARLFGIGDAPALILFRAGVGLYAGPSEFSASQLEALLRRALALDMDEVRRALDRERGATRIGAEHRPCPMSQRGEFPSA